MSNLKKKTCPDCGGAGKKSIRLYDGSTEVRCQTCNGSGSVIVLK